MPPNKSSKPTHTPKPWTFKGGVVVGADGRGLGSSSGRPAGEVDANIALACAAPDILAALADLVERCDGMEGVRADGSNIDTAWAHAVLAKATQGGR